MSLLLHTCCADCTLKFIHDLELVERPDLFFYNPNIHPRSEYQSRLVAIQKIAANTGCKLIIPDWSPRDYFSVIKTKTKPGRCLSCWQLRLTKTAEFAANNNYDSFSSTLITSHYQDSEAIKKIASKIAKNNSLKFIVPAHSNCHPKTSGFYKQFFCGCCYSLSERYQEKYFY